MRALTVRQPWAWAIIFAGKDVENRSRNVAGSHRGPMAVHAGVGPEPGDAWSFMATLGISPPPALAIGGVIGTVNLVDVHTVTRGCCSSPWAERSAGVHLVLRDPKPLFEPIRARGALGLWHVDADLETQIERGA